mmetsp:Transcript_52345/g.83346  ORF Transcript_52345/g.83346 Transcript_52345/m.83346 type:complete len:142 (-) Transcript_52345:171-596(-)
MSSSSSRGKKKVSKGVKGGKGGKATRITKAARAGLTFNVARVLRQMRAGKYAPRVSPTAAVVLAATIEYMVAELLEVSGEAAKDNKKKQIKPRHIMLAARQDNELDLFLKNVTFPYAGNVPGINEVLMRKSKKKKAKKTEE